LHKTKTEFYKIPITVLCNHLSFICHSYCTF